MNDPIEQEIQAKGLTKSSYGGKAASNLLGVARVPSSCR